MEKVQENDCRATIGAGNQEKERVKHGILKREKRQG
jgi:hypothetical protein